VRTDVLAAHDFEVLRFWDNDVLTNTSGVLTVISRRARQLQREQQAFKGCDGDV
jgi:very-short-patch-repair endonuclease